MSARLVPWILLFCLLPGAQAADADLQVFETERWQCTDDLESGSGPGPGPGTTTSWNHATRDCTENDRYLLFDLDLDEAGPATVAIRHACAYHAVTEQSTTEHDDPTQPSHASFSDREVSGCRMGLFVAAADTDLFVGRANHCDSGVATESVIVREPGGRAGEYDANRTSDADCRDAVGTDGGPAEAWAGTTSTCASTKDEHARWFDNNPKSPDEVESWSEGACDDGLWLDAGGDAWATITWRDSWTRDCVTENGVRHCDRTTSREWYAVHTAHGSVFVPTA